MEKNMYRILIVEDDAVIASVIEEQLNKWGYEARRIEDFSNVMSEFGSFSPQLVLMDITLPFFNGYHWCSKIRKVSKLPIIFLSSASDHMNIVMAMNMGGDDFIAKPFDIDVLVAKIQAMLRRTYEFGSAVNLIEHKGAILNLEESAVLVGSEKIDLSKNEFRILSMLMQERGKIVSRETLMERLWETDCYVDENTLTVNVARLRKKLADAGLSDYITTKKGQGYVIL